MNAKFLSLALLTPTLTLLGSESSSTNRCDEHLEAKIVLTPTTNAPTGAFGIAKLKSETEDGIQESILKLKVGGLIAGDYLLSIVTQSDGATNILGQFTVRPDDNDDRGDDVSDHSRGDSEHSGTTERAHHSSRTDDNDDDDNGRGDSDDGRGDHSDGRGDPHSGDVTVVELPLPAEIDPLDIGQITVSDAAGTALLVGDLTNPNPATTLKFRGLVSITAGEGAPTARGKAQIQSQIRKGKRQTRFTLVASQVPAEAIYHVEVNGSAVGTVTSNKKGRLVIKKLPSQQSHIREVYIMDSQGVSAVSTRF
jgi:hypothetical protein